MALAGVQLVRYDAEKGAGIAAARHFNVTGYPTLLLIDPSGKVLNRLEGAPESSQQLGGFLARLAGRRDAASIKALEADTKAGPGRFLISARWYAAHQQRKSALAAYARAVKADRRGTEGVAAIVTWEAAQLKSALDRRATLVAQAALVVEKWPDSPVAGEALPLAVLSGDLPRPRMLKLLAARRRALAGDAHGLNDLIYIAIAAGACDEAIAAGQQQVKLVPENPNPYDSLAEAYHCKGDNKMAVSTEELAMAHADEDGRHEYDDNMARYRAASGPYPGNARLIARANAELDGAYGPDDDHPDVGEGGLMGDAYGSGGFDGDTEQMWASAMQVATEALTKAITSRCRGKLKAGGTIEVVVHLEEEGGRGRDPDYQGPPELERCARDAIAGGPEFPPVLGHAPEVKLQVEVPAGEAPPARPLKTTEPPRKQ
jgi:hypothetical protein